MELNDVWTLETSDEVKAIANLGAITRLALAGDNNARQYLRELWDDESWRAIKAKLETEGSAWYVWWMDGVRQHAGNIARGAFQFIEEDSSRYATD